MGSKIKIIGRNKIPKISKKKVDRLKEFNKQTEKKEMELMESMEFTNKKGAPIQRNSMFRNCKLLPDIIQKFKDGESSIAIARFLLNESTGDLSIRSRYKTKNKEVAIASLSSNLRKFRLRIIRDVERYPNFNFAVFVQRYNSSINEIAEIEKLISYLFHRIDKWVEIEKTSPFPMKEARKEIMLALESLHKLIVAKQSLSIDVKMPKTLDVNAEESEGYQNLQKVLDKLSVPERKKRIDDLSEVPSLNRQSVF